MFGLFTIICFLLAASAGEESYGFAVILLILGGIFLFAEEVFSGKKAKRK